MSVVAEQTLHRVLQQQEISERTGRTDTDGKIWTVLYNSCIKNALRSFWPKSRFYFFYLSTWQGAHQPKSVIEIGDGAFFGNEQLRSVQYRPAQIKRIGGAAFFGCTKLSAINGLIGLRFGEGLEEIGSFAFQNCKSITSVSISNSTKLIDGRAFYDCDNLELIIFDGNQVVIKSDAFKKCKNLRNIEIDEKLFAKYCDCFDGEWNLK